ncbi:MAG: M48 family metalloprotease, partial [Desulfobacterales bacterium]|nr:M48 family metalloprotease [Desulfobacterales bacterium]
MLIRRPQRRVLFYMVSLLISSFLIGAFIRDVDALTAEEEKKMGKTVLLEIEKEADFMRDLTIQTFIDKLGYSIVDQVGPTPFEFKFYVVNGLDPNAFAIPGGYIFVTTGLLVLAENEQEVAGVLSH